MNEYNLQISLKAARVNAGLTLMTASKLLGICKDTLIKWEKYPDKVSPEWQKKIYALYKLSMGNIFFGI